MQDAGWFPLADCEAVGAAPAEAEAGRVGWWAARPAPEAPVAVVEARCPHRLVRLAHGGVDGGRLRCPYHGWEFGSDGACAVVPSNGPDAAVPPRARLRTPWGVREDAGTIWIAPTAPGQPDAEPDRRAEDQLLTNVDPSLRSGWHPVALASEL